LKSEQFCTAPQSDQAYGAVVALECW